MIHSTSSRWFRVRNVRWNSFRCAGWGSVTASTNTLMPVQISHHRLGNRLSSNSSSAILHRPFAFSIGDRTLTSFSKTTTANSLLRSPRPTTDMTTGATNTLTSPFSTDSDGKDSIRSTPTIPRNIYATVAANSFAKIAEQSSSSSSSSSSYDAEPSDPQEGETDDAFRTVVPAKLTSEMAAGIMQTMQFFLRHGVAAQRLRNIAVQDDLVTVQKWQLMMEVFFLTQVSVIAALGYPATEKGLAIFIHHLSTCMNEIDETMQNLLQDVRRETWREVVAMTFLLKVEEIPSLKIVEARDLMHKIASRMTRPDILEKIETQVAAIEESDPELLMARRHNVLQNVIVDDIYLGGSPSLVEEAGFGSGGVGYAKMQCAMTDYEADPLVMEYTRHAMLKLWKASRLYSEEEEEEPK